MSGAVICVLLILSGLFLLAMRISRENSKAKKSGYVVIPFDDTTEELEFKVKCVYWEECFDSELTARKILLTEVSQGENSLVAQKLADEYENVYFVKSEQLYSFIKNDFIVSDIKNCT